MAEEREKYWGALKRQSPLEKEELRKGLPKDSRSNTKSENISSESTDDKKIVFKSRLIIMLSLAFLAGSISHYFFQKIAGPRNFNECVLSEMNGKPREALGLAGMVCLERFSKQ